MLKAPFPYFGGKRSVTAEIWARFGRPRQYIEPFCGSAAVLLAAPKPASLEVVGDASGFIANFWRAVKYQPAEVARAADYPVSHVDLGARHAWLLSRHAEIAEALHDAEWPGDAQAAGWWLWGQCAWIGSGWCEKVPHVGDAGMGVQAAGRVPHVSDPGRGVQAVGRVPHVSDPGRGVQAVGRVPHVGNAGRGVQAAGKVSHVSDAGMMTSGGETAWRWLHKLSARLERVRLIHGDWSRCLNHHYGGSNTAIFLDPPYISYENLYADKTPVAAEVAGWARDNQRLRIALCGLTGDYDLPGWDAVRWSRGKATYGSSKTADDECIWYSPACLNRSQIDMFMGSAE